METIGSLRNCFAENVGRLPFTALPEIQDEGLMLGHGTVLARMGYRQGEEMLMLQADEGRLLALLSAVYGRQVSPRVMHHIARASDQWRRGDRALANIELAYARLPRLETREDSFRLFLAEDLLARGMTPRRLARALGFDPDLLKYDPNQPREPAAHGRQSGEWIKIEDAKATDASANVSSPRETRSAGTENTPSALDMTLLAAAPRGVALLGQITPFALDALATLALRFSVPTIIGGALFIPTPNSGGIEDGEVPDLPGVRYHFDGQAGVVSITAAVDDKKLGVEARLAPGGIYVDQQGRALGRFLGTSIYLDSDTIVAALHDQLGSRSKEQPSVGSQLSTHPEEPKLCPDPSPDRPGARNKVFDIAYAEYVDQEIVNPGYPPLPPGLAFSLFNPVRGKMVHFDGCKYTTGDPQEYKGHYEDLMAKKFFTEWKLKEEFLKQANSQIGANVAANIRNGRINTDQWRFDERETADFAWDIFEKEGYLGRGKIRIHYTPYWEHTDELYADPEN